MDMLDWFKRIATPIPPEQLVEKENQTLSADGEVERPVNPFEAGEPLAATEFGLLPTERKVERLVSRLRAAEPLVEAQSQPPSTEEALERLVEWPGVNMASPSEPTGGFRDMRVIVVASQKGGCGKTTIAAHLAVQAGMAGDGPAVLVDGDWQGSLAEWWRARNDDALALATVNPGELTAMRADGLVANLTELRRRGFAVAIIDTPPSRTAAVEQVIAIADLVLIPARPSPHDLRAVGATVEMARRWRKQFLFVVNGAAPRANITAEAVAALSEHGPVAPVILFQRTDYAASMTDGRTVMEAAASGRSAQEIAELWKHVYSRISMRAAA